MQAEINRYEINILRALVSKTPEQMGCDSAADAVAAFYAEMDMQPIDLLKHFIGVCTITEMEYLKYIDYDITEKMTDQL